MKKKLTFLLIALVTITSACNEEVLDIKNQNQYSDATYFTTASTFNEAVVATYATLLMKGLYSRDYYFIMDLLANDAANNVPLSGDIAQFQNYNFGPAQPQLTDLWQNLYRMTFRANLVLHYAEQWQPVLDADIAKKTQYVSEAHFLRGFGYFQLVNLWGRVPLKTDYETQMDATPRSSVEEVWAVVESDFQMAIEGLPIAYDNANLGRATKGAAIAMLGKSYLYQGKYTQAEQQLKQLTTAPFTYSLNPDYDQQFSAANGGSPETIFDVPHGEWQGWGVGDPYYMFGGQEAWGRTNTHSGRAMEYGWNDWNNTLVSSATVNAFKYKDESNVDYIDPRAKLTFYGDAASGGDTDFCHTCTEAKKGGDIQNAYAPVANTPGPYIYPFGFSTAIGYNWRKYQQYETLEFEGLPQSTINSQVIRYADVLLMLAESLIEQNKAEEALPYINEVRARVGAFEYTSLGNQSEARTILRRERRLEFAGEQSRWFDLNRWGIAAEVLNQEKGGQLFQEKHKLLPIPQIEKDTNPSVASDVSNDWN